MINLREVKPGDPVKAIEENELRREVRRLGKLRVAAPLEMHDSAGGIQISLAQGPSDFFLVKTNYLSGADGTSTTPCAYLYDVYQTDGTTLIESGVAVIGPRPNGLTTAAPNGSYAQACRIETSALKLWSTLEKPTDDICT